jgi:hypothetical protein
LKTDLNIHTAKALVEVMARALVDYPEKVQVTEIAGNATRMLELRVAKPDMGKIIGKHGRNATAMRHIVSAASAKSRQRIVLEILET